MAQPEHATFADLVALGGDARVEVIHGELVRKANPTFEHASAQGHVHAFLMRRFDRHAGGRWPGGWWFGPEIDVQYATHEIFRHDAAGWRRDRHPDRPSGWPVMSRPDWVCEILSPSNAKHDLIDKWKVLHAAQTPHYWILDPDEKTLRIHRWAPEGFVTVLAAASGDVVRAEPFDAVELRVAVLFGDEPDDE